MKAWLAIDNGVTGSVAFITEAGRARFAPTPVKSEQNYTKKKANITRINVNKLYAWIVDCFELIEGGYLIDRDRIMVIIERPFVNPKMFQASMSAVRSLEATMAVCESLLLPIQVMDSKEWQREMLPQGTIGKDELKKASLDIGNRKFPQFQDSKMKDRDSLLMAEYCRLNNL